MGSTSLKKSANARSALQADNSGPLKMNVLSVAVVGTIADVGAILGLAWCGLHL